jgi:transposase
VIKDKDNYGGNRKQGLTVVEQVQVKDKLANGDSIKSIAEAHRVSDDYIKNLKAHFEKTGKLSPKAASKKKDESEGEEKKGLFGKKKKDESEG